MSAQTENRLEFQRPGGLKLFVAARPTGAVSAWIPFPQSSRLLVFALSSVPTFAVVNPTLYLDRTSFELEPGEMQQINALILKATGKTP